MLVQAAEEVSEAQADVSIPTEPSTSKPHKMQKSKKQQSIAPKVPSPVPSPEHQLPLPSTNPIPTAKDSLTLQELIDLCTRFSNKVLDLESEVTDIKFSFIDRNQKLEDRVDQLEEENMALKEKSFKTTQVDTAAPAKAYNLDLQHPEKILSMQDIDEEEPAKVEEVLEVVKAAKLMTKVFTTAQPTTTAAQVPKPSTPRRRRDVIIQDPEEIASSVIIDMDEEFARQLEAELNANINWNDVVEKLKRSEIRPTFEKHYNSIQAFLEKREDEITVQEKGNKRQGESLKQEITKKQRINEVAEELKTHLQIMANDDDVYTEATPLASKVLIVDYLIHHENNKPYYKIIRADGTHKLFLSFITLLKDFDRDDLETLWKIVKERFESTESKNFSDDFLLNTFKIMFEKPNVKANMIILVEKKYPLAHFTLQQMLDNVRLEVEEESEMSLELLR
nr:hypothetical protein [Tanacetum cinerariifolium]